MSRVAVGALVSSLVLGLLAGCGSGPDHSAAPPSTPATTHTASSSPPARLQRTVAGDDRALDVAVSSPRRDSVYPDVGQPGVDALHYGLDLTWTPARRRLTAHESLVFRSTRTAPSVRLDLGRPLRVSHVLVDGRPVRSRHRGATLVVSGAFERDHRYLLTLDYAGTPRPVRAPTTRDDIPALGFTIDRDRQVWTMQEPYGAFTWYAVNDQPSDKALYDYTLHVAAPWTGIAGGAMTADRLGADGVRTTRFHLDRPAAAYLTTLAFGDYQHERSVGPHGLPISYWIPSDRPELLHGPDTTPEALAFLERYLGRYPFDTAGVLVVRSDSGMETQGLVTLGDTAYATSPAVVVHELAHQWYGDEVTPDDWRDLWMSEGMAMYLQLMFQAKQAHLSMADFVEGYRSLEQQARRDSGPPAAYDPAHFGDANVYLGPALMWQALRERIGDRRFFSLVRAWPRHAAGTSTGRDAYLAFVERRTGLHLQRFWDAWLLGRRTPS